MAKKLLFCLMAAVMVLGVILVGCGGGGGDGGQPITIKMLIRNNDQRLGIGDYVGNQLEALGFETERQYGPGSVLSPIWLSGDPRDGEWHLVTGAWINTAVPRDEATNFGFFDTPLGAYSLLWDFFEPSENYLGNATKLYTNDFANMGEREDLFEATVPLSMEGSQWIWTDDRASFTPLQKDVACASDAYGGIEGSWLWAHTIHFRDLAGTPVLPLWDGGAANLTLRVALEDLIVEPWNGVMGSNWAFDQFAIRATCDNAFEYDVNDGLVWPHIATKADVIVKAGLPVGQTGTSTPWLNFSTTPGNISVPTTAWANWDATAQDFVNVAPGTTALTKTVVYYPTGTFGRPLHDGSTMDKEDFLLYAIMQFDRADSNSLLYDESYAPNWETFMTHFKGVDFDFSRTGEGYDLVVTHYDDQFYLDAELLARANSWFPNGNMAGGNLGPYVFDNIALGVLAEENGLLAFSNSKSDGMGIPWLSYVAGPSLDILHTIVTNITTPGNPYYRFLPYRDFLGAYVTNATLDTRYGNLHTWYTNLGHFWVGPGPYYLSDIDTLGDKLELDPFTSYPDDGTDWFFLMNPVPVTPPAHDGAWVDKITLEISLPHSAAIDRLQADTLDVYAAGLADADLYEEVKADTNLHYYLSAGLFDGLCCNPVGLFFPGTGKMNPFSLPVIREAMNWLIDRDHIVGEIFGGMAYARYTCVGTKTGDYINRYPALFAATNAAYAYNFALANSTIYAAMMAINGTTYVDGKYYYEAP